MEAVFHYFFNADEVHTCRPNSVTLLLEKQKGLLRYEELVNYNKAGNNFSHWLYVLLHLFKYL